MNLNKELPSGSSSLIVAFIFSVVGVLLLIPGLTSFKTDDGSGLGGSLGQITIFFSVIAFLIALVAFIKFKKSR